MEYATNAMTDAADAAEARTDDGGCLYRCDQCGRLGLAWFFPVICSPERLCADCA